MINSLSKLDKLMDFIRNFEISKKNFFKLGILIGFTVFIYLQFLLLKSFFGLGLNHDDITTLLNTRFWGDDLWSKITNNWTQLGPHYAYQHIYMYILDYLFGSNFTLYRITSMVLRFIEILTLYFLVSITLKDKLLAILATLIYSISAASTGALFLLPSGGEYLAAAFMNLFFLSYFFLIKKGSLLIPTSLLLLLSYLASPVRVFPIFSIILITEIFLLLDKKTKFVQSLSRIIIFILPIAFIMLPVANFIVGSGDVFSLNSKNQLFKVLSEGNLWPSLNPLAGLGYMFLSMPNFNLLGSMESFNFVNYLFFLMYGPIKLFAIILLPLSFVISKQPLRFFAITLLSYFIFALLVFLILVYPSPNSIYPRLDYTAGDFKNYLNAVLIGGTVLIFSISCGLEWLLDGRKNKLLFIAFISIPFAGIFITGQWLFTQLSYTHIGAAHRYLTIPQIGTSIFMATLITLSYRKYGNHPYQKIVLVTTTLFLFFFFSMGEAEVTNANKGEKLAGRDLKMQNDMQTPILNNIPHNKLNGNLLFYIETVHNPKTLVPHLRAFDLSDFVNWMIIRKSYYTERKVAGCIAIFWDDENLLKESATIKEGERGFLYDYKVDKNMNSFCIHEGETKTSDDLFYKLEDFHAFSIQGSKVENITQKITDKIPFE